MSSTSLSKKSFSRRSFVGAAGSAAGVLAAFKAVALEGKGAPVAPVPAAEPVAPVVEAAAAAPVPLAAHKTAKSVSAARATRVVDAASLPQAGEEVLRSVGALKPGSNVYGYKVVGVYGVYMGAIPVVMQDKKGERFQVDICAADSRSSAPQAVTTTKSLSFFLANGGNGAHPSDESKGLGAIALATYLGRKRTAGFRPAGLMTLSERNATYPFGAFTISV